MAWRRHAAPRARSRARSAPHRRGCRARRGYPRAARSSRARSRPPPPPPSPPATLTTGHRAEARTVASGKPSTGLPACQWQCQCQWQWRGCVAPTRRRMVAEPETAPRPAWAARRMIPGGSPRPRTAGPVGRRRRLQLGQALVAARARKRRRAGLPRRPLRKRARWRVRGGDEGTPVRVGDAARAWMGGGPRRCGGVHGPWHGGRVINALSETRRAAPRPEQGRAQSLKRTRRCRPCCGHGANGALGRAASH